MLAHLDAAAATATTGIPQPLFPQPAFTTAWRELAVLELAPAQRFTGPQSTTTEIGYLVVAGGVEVRGVDVCGVDVCRGGARTVVAPAAVLCGLGCEHELLAAEEGARVIVIGVHLGVHLEDEIDDHQAFLYDTFDPARLQWRDAIHGGGGRIATRHLWRPQDFASSWTFVDHAILSQDSSLGHHHHDFLDEVFVVLAGRGWMTIGGQTHEIGPGSVTFQAPGQGHGLYNPFPAELDFVRVAVAAAGETFTTIDLDDDLRRRRPSTQEPAT